MKRLIRSERLKIDNYEMSLYDNLNKIFHNNIPKTYLLHYVTDKMLAEQIKEQMLGKKRITDTSYKDIVRRYVTKYRTLDDLDFANIIKTNNLCNKMLEDLINNEIIDNDLCFEESNIIKYIQSFQPKVFEIEDDYR